MYVDDKCATGIENQRTVGFGYFEGIEELVKNRRFYRQSCIGFCQEPP